MSGLQTTPWMLDEPIALGKHQLRGRVYVPAHQCALAKDGQPTKAYLDYYRVRARAGAAMQITGATPVTISGLWTSGRSLVNVDESVVPAYQRLADTVRGEGGKILAQLAHPGPTDDGVADVIGPSRIFSEISRQVVREASISELDEIVRCFATAADRCRRGGLDGIEISLAHGLLLAAFLSPLTNHRDDAYGGELENRLAFPLQVVRAVRDAVHDDLIVGVRLVADDLVPGGLEPADAARIGSLLASDVDYISVIAGNNTRFEARIKHWPPTPASPGLFRGLARTVREAVSVPVCAVGRITSPSLANDILVHGDADLVGMVRAHIADPELLTKTRAGRVEDVRPCVGCNFCITEDLAGRAVRCTVNPDITSGDWLPKPSTEQSARVVVIGGGVAGLEAARRAALLGFGVLLFEQDEQVGGQVYRWSTASSRAEFREFLSWEERQLAALGVELRLGTRAWVDEVMAFAPRAVIVATGAVPASVDLRSDSSVAVLDAFSALANPPDGRVVIYDAVGGLDAALIAERIVETTGAQVSLVTSRIHLGEGEGITATFPMFRRLADLHIAVIERAYVRDISNGVVRLTGVFGEARTPITGDVFVPWTGGESQSDLGSALQEAGCAPIVIGDALRPRRVHDAVREGSEAGRRVAVQLGEVCS